MGVRELPSRESLQDILEKLLGVSFRVYFGRPDPSNDGIDYFVGCTLEATLGRALWTNAPELEHRRQMSN